MRSCLVNHDKHEAKVQATTVPTVHVVDVGVTPVLLSSLNVLPTALRRRRCCCSMYSTSILHVRDME